MAVSPEAAGSAIRRPQLVTTRGKLRIIFESEIFMGRRLSHTDAVIVFTTIANEEEAVKLIRELLDRRLIACGTVQSGGRSIYRWEGKIADETEAILMLKTRSGCVEGLRRAFTELHPYKVPELLAIPVTGGLERYLGWINSETSLTLA